MMMIIITIILMIRIIDLRVLVDDDEYNVHYSYNIQ